MQNVEDVYSLTPAQQGMLFHTLYDPELGVYIEHLSWALRGGLDVAAFEMSWRKVVERHPVLRSAFFLEGLDEPLQVVRKQVEVVVEHRDWAGLAEAEFQKSLNEFLDADRLRGFQLSTAPLMRVTLIRLDDKNHMVIWSHHHMLLDGWSTMLVLKELFLFYYSIRNGHEVKLEECLPYRDYIAWIRDQQHHDAEEFWRRLLKGITYPTPLKVNLASGQAKPGRSGVGSSEIHISEMATAALQLQARRNQLTLNTVAQGAWALLLSRYSGEQDVVFGSIISNRPPELLGVEFTVGLFLNALPVRAKAYSEITISRWLTDLQAQQVEARQYQYVPLPQIQGWSETPRGLPLFQTTIAFENFPVDKSLLEQNLDLEIHQFVRYGSMTNFPINVVVEPGRAILLQIGYDSRSFDSITVDRMLAHFKTLLEAMSDDLEQRLESLSLLTNAERDQILVEWSPRHPISSPERCAPQLFEEQAEASPDAIALQFQDEHLSYRALNSRSNQVANYLVSLGVGPEVVVGLYLERSLEMIVGLLGVMKAGGAYLPLDPSYPPDRLDYILNDAVAPVLLSQEKLITQLPASWTQIVCLDSDWNVIAERGAQHKSSPVEVDGLGYVIYTSGSTGKPKGVLVSHRGLFNLCEAQIAAFGARLGSRVLQFASLSFDASVSEIFTTLLSGATLCLAGRESLLPGPSITGLLKDHQISIATFPPSMLATLSPSDCQSFETVVLAGEASSAELIGRWKSSSWRLLNAYGPTEATVCATIASCADDTNGPTIGYPIGGTNVFLLGLHHQPVPVAVPGELHISGVGLARGYMNRADLTAEKFIPNHFSQEPGARLYKTGDLARYQPDGRIQFIGRVDTQVKLRGYRIELEEIEFCLRNQPNVQDAAALVREDQSGDKILVGYLVAEPGAEFSVDQLRRSLQRQLPDYMTPAEFVVLESLPLSSNGKVDRRLLPALGGSKLKVDSDYIGPRTELEELLSFVWAQTFGLERVGIDDNFFALGGDSIRSIQILSKMQEMGWSFTLPQIFKFQTIRALARELFPVETDPCPPFSLISNADRIKLSDEIEDAYPLTMLQKGMIFHSQSRPDTAIYHSIISIHLEAELNQNVLLKAINIIVNLHPTLRTSFDMVNFSEPLQLVRRAVNVWLQVEDLRRLSKAEQELVLHDWLETEKGKRFDWTCPPLISFTAHHRAEKEFQLTFTAHHSIIDGWSDSLLLTQLSEAYNALLEGNEYCSDAAPASSFRDYVSIERKALACEDTSLYWTNRLSGSLPTVLPRFVKPGPAADAGQFGTVEARVQAEVSAKLIKLAKNIVVPLKYILLAAHLKVLNVISGRRDLLTGLVTNARPEDRDGDRIVGLFLNTLPFRFDLSGGSWIELAEKVFEAERDLLPYRYFPLAQIHIDCGRQNLFETCFNFTYFHLYRERPISDNVKVLSTSSVTETNLAMLAHFSLDPNSSDLHLSIDYDAREFDRRQIESISTYYLRTLDTIALDPFAPYEFYSPMSPEERRWLLIDCNLTDRELPGACLIHHLFDAQAERGPDAIALIYDDQQVSYRELNRRSNQLANYLRRLGVGLDEVVSLYMDRSVEMLIGILAILKAGGAYLPLSRNLPADRLEFMLTDSRASLLITQASVVDEFPCGDMSVTCIDEDWETIALESDQSVAHGADQQNLAYVIYTSGSTGKPKGVQVTHQSVSNFLLSMLAQPGLSRQDVLSSVTSLSFDIAALELFLPIIAGGRVIIIDNEAISEGELLRARLAETGTTVLQATPAAWQMILNGGKQTRSQLKVLCGGESLSQGLAARLLEISDQVWNLYGPTETTIWSTINRLESADNSLTIGCPISNTRVFILDEWLVPVPPGTPGDLYISGIGLARGYLGAAEMTAERFLPAPYVQYSGARMYKTGDVARYLPDGKIEFIGRIDNQVKVRGVRIELAEIEAALGAHQGVSEAVVLASEEPDGQKSLTAYLVCNNSHYENKLEIKELCAYLTSRLPTYMVPSSFMLLDRMPLTPNGKVDRRALPLAQGLRLRPNVEFVAPTTPIEQKLVELCAETLKVDQVGIYDNFFDLGGHSLAAAQLIYRINQIFKLNLTARSIFEEGTVAGLALLIEDVIMEKLEVERDPELEAAFVEGDF